MGALVNPLSLTSLYAALLTLWYLFLSFYVIRWRWKARQGLGDGQNVKLQRAIRVHGNFSEYIPLSLLLMAFLEIRGLSNPYLHSFGIGLVLGRALHFWGLRQSSGTSLGRFSGTLLTQLALTVGSLYLLFSLAR